MAKQLNLQGSHRPNQGVPVPVRRNSLAQPHANSPAQAGMTSEEDREDEMMVEDMLVEKPMAAAPTAPWATHNQYQPQPAWTPAPTPIHTQMSTPQPPPVPQFGAPQQCAQEQPSLFTTTDPFYLSITQHAQQAYFSRAHHGSVFQIDGGAVLVDR